MQEMWVRFLGEEDPLEKEMATHSGILAKKIPCTEEPAGLQSMGSQTVGHDWAIKQQQQRSTEEEQGLKSRQSVCGLLAMWYCLEIQDIRRTDWSHQWLGDWG